ncbi:sialidase family protein [Sphingobacterium faecale]|uniref:exo-alpha-sialidase n=1 Tax=Sphingobacterium faecale TaxID=2803775 RepID=A0ABS1R3Y4_9SPHI|nr:sialidase family protein [Sphingobacterium faecale]MBL1409412.1 exo-alpha-sialidase [Sphingobacterium faecale]
MKKILSFISLLLVVCCFTTNAQKKANKTKVKWEKVKDIVIYKDSLFYASFPSIVKTKGNNFLLAFRRAPERRIFGEGYTMHVDPNSYLVQMTSKDGENWAKEPQLLYAHAFGGSQDPCLLTLRDGTLLCASYGWSFLREDGKKKLKGTHFHSNDGTFLGGYLVSSRNNGKTWQGPIYPPAISQEVNHDMYGNKVPVYNRGALVEGKNGRLYWVVAATDNAETKKTSNYLMVSDDKGKTWKYQAVVAQDPKISFNETSIYETPKGDLVAFLRTAGYDDQACIARSTDRGNSFEWKSMGFKGHPLQALRLPDNRVLIVYGYRHKPFGIRARVLNAECTDFETSEEIVLRDDAGSGDIGYPWAVQLDKNKVLVTYYFNKENGTRYIAGTVLEAKK